MKDIFKGVLKLAPVLSTSMSLRNDIHFVELLVEASHKLYGVSALENLPKHSIDNAIDELTPLLAAAAMMPISEVVIFSDPVIKTFIEPELKDFIAPVEDKVKFRFATSHHLHIRNAIIIVTNTDTSDTYPSFYPVRHDIIGAVMIDPDSYPRPPSLMVNL